MVPSCRMGGDTLGGDSRISSGARPHCLSPQLVRSGTVGPGEHPRVMEDACLNAATTVAHVDTLWVSSHVPSSSILHSIQWHKGP